MTCSSRYRRKICGPSGHTTASSCVVTISFLELPFGPVQIVRSSKILAKFIPIGRSFYKDGVRLHLGNEYFDRFRETEACEVHHYLAGRSYAGSRFFALELHARRTLLGIDGKILWEAMSPNLSL